MAKMSFDGVDDMIAQLKKLEVDTRNICTNAVYAGAGVIADATKATIGELKVGEGGERGARQAREWEVEALKQGLGISHIEHHSDGYVDVKVGFDGYYDHDGKKVPIPLVARSIESGTAFMHKQRFVSKAAKKAKPEVEKTMQNVVDEKINEITKG